VKTKIWGSLLVILLAAAVIVGATSAWFTDDTDIPEAEFTAGTVMVDADGPEYAIMEGKSIENINPGDCARVTWTIINKGTKNAELRVKIDKLWETEPSNELLAKIKADFPELTINNAYDLAQLLDESIVHIAPAPDSGWVMYRDDNGDVWLCYQDGPLTGTYYLDEGEDEDSVDLTLVVAFEGPAMDNKYMGARLLLNGTAYAVQASNGAPEAVFGEEFVDAKKGKGTFIDEYFLTGPGKDLHCW